MEKMKNEAPKYPSKRERDAVPKKWLGQELDPVVQLRRLLGSRRIVPDLTTIFENAERPDQILSQVADINFGALFWLALAIGCGWFLGWMIGRWITPMVGFTPGIRGRSWTKLIAGWMKFLRVVLFLAAIVQAELGANRDGKTDRDPGDGLLGTVITSSLEIDSGIVGAGVGLDPTDPREKSSNSIPARTAKALEEAIFGQKRHAPMAAPAKNRASPAPDSFADVIPAGPIP